MMITRQNYELFLIDYLDGNLTPSQVEKLMSFLKDNPDIKEEFDGVADTVMAREDILFPNKSLLKKNSFLKNGISSELDYLCIAANEGDLDAKEKEQIQQIINQNPENRITAELYQKTNLKPDLGKVYSGKGALKRVRIFHLRQSTSRIAIGVAASLLLFVGSYTIIKLSINTIPENTANSSIAITANQSVEVKQQEENKEEIRLRKPTITVPVREHINKAEKNQVVALQESPEIPIDEIQPIKSISIYPQTATSAEKIARIDLPKNQNRSNANIEKGSMSGTKVIGLFEIAQIGINSFGRLIGKDINLEAKRDKKGKIEKIHFESEMLAFTTTVKKE